VFAAGPTVERLARTRRSDSMDTFSIIISIILAILDIIFLFV